MNDVCIRYTNLTDNLTVRGFATLSPASLSRFNADVGTSLGMQQLTYMHEVFDRDLRRDPTVGEIRLLAAIERASVCHPDRIVAREMTCESEDIASTWADAMDKHRRLNEQEGKPPSPATLTDILQIPEQLAALDASRTSAASALSVLPEDGHLSAVASWRLPECSLHSPVGNRLVCTELPPVRAASKRVKAGDLLLLVQDADHALLALCLSSLYDVTVTDLHNTSIISAVLSSCEGAELYAEALTDTRGYLPYELLCADGQADCVLRIPTDRLAAVRMALQGAGGQLVTFGRVRRDSRILIHHLIPHPPVGDPPVEQPPKRQPVVDLPTRVLRDVTVAYGYAFHPASNLPLPSFDMPDTPRAGHTVFVPERRLFAAFTKADITEAGQGFALAAHAIAEALAALPTDAAHPTLSVAVDGSCTPDVLFETVCGLYRAAVETASPMTDTSIRVDTSCTSVSLHISICAWATAVQTAAVQTAAVQTTAVQTASEESET